LNPGPTRTGCHRITAEVRHKVPKAAAQRGSDFSDLLPSCGGSKLGGFSMENPLESPLERSENPWLFRKDLGDPGKSWKKFWDT